jgi:hypothetical protein
MLMKDIKLRSMEYYADLDVNMCSIESPILYSTNSNQYRFFWEWNKLYNDQRFLNYDHYRKVVEAAQYPLQKMKWINWNKPSTFCINQRTAQKVLIDLQIKLQPPLDTSKRIAETLWQWA